MAHITLGGKPVDYAALVRERVPQATASGPSDRWHNDPQHPFWYIFPSDPKSESNPRGFNMLQIGVGGTEEAAWLDAWQRQEEEITQEQALADEDCDEGWTP